VKVELTLRDGISTVHAEERSIDHVDMRVAVGRMGIEQSAGLMCKVWYVTSEAYKAMIRNWSLSRMKLYASTFH